MSWAESIYWQDPTWVLISFLAGFLISVAGWTFYTRLFHPLSRIPGPFWASISRFWLAYQISSGRAEVIQRSLHEKFGLLYVLAFPRLADIAQDLLCG